MFSCEYCGISKNTFSTKPLRTTASAFCKVYLKFTRKKLLTSLIRFISYKNVINLDITFIIIVHTNAIIKHPYQKFEYWIDWISPYRIASLKIKWNIRLEHFCNLNI